MEQVGGGERGIRTLGGVAPTPVFETGPFNHSGTSPALIKKGYSDGKLGWKGFVLAAEAYSSE